MVDFNSRNSPGSQAKSTILKLPGLRNTDINIHMISFEHLRYGIPDRQYDIPCLTNWVPQVTNLTPICYGLHFRRHGNVIERNPLLKTVKTPSVLKHSYLFSTAWVCLYSHGSDNSLKSLILVQSCRKGEFNLGCQAFSKPCTPAFLGLILSKVCSWL